MEISKLNEVLEGEPKYRKSQAQQAFFHDLIDDWEQATGLPKKLRGELNEKCPLGIKAELFTSGDGLTSKALITLTDGKAIETVLMRHQDGRNTLCVSCMVGCPMNCTFCATGTMGLSRNLTTDEIITQAVLFARLLKKDNERIGSVVFMGMGEPLLNYDNVMAAVRQMQSPNGFNIGARHISISTCGILDGIKKLAKEDLPLNLAVSLHGSNDIVRRELMPIARTYTIKELLQTIDEYIQQTKRKVMFEYLMIKGVNDKDEHALDLAGLLKNKLAFINLIQYNPTGTYTATSTKQMDRFKNILEKNGITVTTRYRFGQDIDGACGQLVIKKK